MCAQLCNKKNTGLAICQEFIKKYLNLRFFFFKIQGTDNLNACPQEIGKKTLNTSPAMNFFFYQLYKKPNRDFIKQNNKENGILFIAVLLLSFENTFLLNSEVNG